MTNQSPYQTINGNFYQNLNTIQVHRKTRKQQLAHGFTLVELMIVIAIIAILATIAIPSYQSYTAKAAMSELIQVATPYRTEVELCLYDSAELTNCNAGNNGIQSDNDGSKFQYVKSIAVENGIVSVAGKGTLDGYSYTMTPAGGGSNAVTWTVSCSGSDKSLYPAGFCG